MSVADGIINQTHNCLTGGNLGTLYPAMWSSDSAPLLLSLDGLKVIDDAPGPDTPWWHHVVENTHDITHASRRII